MSTMCDIGWAWGNEAHTTADTIGEFVEFLVAKQYTRYGGQVIATPRTDSNIEPLTPKNVDELRQYIHHHGLDELSLDFEYNARYMDACWPSSGAEQLAKEVEDAASRAAYAEDIGLAGIDIYSGIRLRRSESTRFDEKGLPVYELSGWVFTVGGDGYVTDMDNLEKHLLAHSPCMVDIRQAIERIFKESTTVVCIES